MKKIFIIILVFSTICQLDGQIVSKTENFMATVKGVYKEYKWGTNQFCTGTTYDSQSGLQGYNAGFQSIGNSDCFTETSSNLVAVFSHSSFLNSAITKIVIKFEIRAPAGSSSPYATIDVYRPEEGCASSDDYQVLYNCIHIANGETITPIKMNVASTNSWVSQSITIDANSNPNLMIFNQTSNTYYVGFDNDAGVVEVKNISCDITYNCTPPTIPTGLTATAVSTSQINLSWPVVANATSYNIYTCAGTTAIASVTSTNYAITGLEPGTTLSYCIKAVNGCGISEISNCASATTDVAVDFLIDDEEIVPGKSAAFTNTSSSTFDIFNWSFPGGTPNSSTLENPVIAYNTSGSFTITLSATSSSMGITRTKTKTIYVDPSYSCIGSVTIQEGYYMSTCFGEPITLHAIGSSEAGGSIKYTWSIFKLLDCTYGGGNRIYTTSKWDDGSFTYTLPAYDGKCLEFHVEISNAYCDLMTTVDGGIAATHTEIAPSAPTFTGPELLGISTDFGSTYNNSASPLIANNVTFSGAVNISSGADVTVKFGESTTITGEFHSLTGSKLSIQDVTCFKVSAAKSTLEEIVENPGSKPTVNNSIELNSVLIYPNPTKDFITIHFNNAHPLYYDIYSISGQLISREDNKGIDNSTHDFRRYDKGLYIFRFVFESSIVYKKVLYE